MRDEGRRLLTVVKLLERLSISTILPWVTTSEGGGGGGGPGGRGGLGGAQLQLLKVSINTPLFFVLLYVGFILNV